MYYTDQVPLETEEHFDVPSVVVHTAVVLWGTHDDIHRAEQFFGRSVLYVPRVTERNRPVGRCRRPQSVTIMQWPGYAFLHSLHEDKLDEVRSRFLLRPLRHDRIVRIPVSQLQPSRRLEAISARRASSPSSAPLPPEQPMPGDLVSVQAGSWSKFVGVVVEVRRGMVIVEIPKSDLHVRADVGDVEIIDRKKVLAHPPGSGYTRRNG